MSKDSTYAQLQKAASRAQGYAAAVAVAAAKALEGMDAEKADKGSAVQLTIPATGWILDEPNEEAEDSEIEMLYPYHRDVPVQGITAKDRADVMIAPTSMEAARNCGLCNSNDTMAGKIRFWAVAIPSTAIKAQLWIGKGKE